MSMRRALTVLLVAVAVGAPAFAAAAVPDPSWIGGLYDGGDADDFVMLVWDQSLGVPPLVAPAVTLARATVDPPVAPRLAGTAAVPPSEPRAPPAR
ncbi:MAG: hypothetical protein HY294_02110 [Candidatus Rokubacteria bacterium]|nr:hypothetical protein [Candidatus Rokubacteria bacterium]